MPKLCQYEHYPSETKKHRSDICPWCRHSWDNHTQLEGSSICPNLFWSVCEKSLEQTGTCGCRAIFCKAGIWHRPLPAN